MVERVKDVLLVVSTAGFAEDSAAYAIEKAASQPGASLHVLLVCEPEGAYLPERLAEGGWIGDRTADDLSHTISKDRRTRGYRILSGIARDAQTEDVPAQTQVCEGEVEPEVRKFVEKHPAAEIILSTPSPGLLERLFGKARRDTARRLEVALGVPVKEFHYE